MPEEQEETIEPHNRLNEDRNAILREILDQVKYGNKLMTEILKESQK